MTDRLTDGRLIYVPLETVAQDRLLAAWNDAADWDRLTPAVLAEKLEAEPPEARAVGRAAIADGVVVGWAFGVLRESTAERRGVVKMLAVVPAFRGRGIGSELLAAIESSLTKAGATVIRFGESAPNYLVPGVDLRCESLLTFLEQRGYTRIGTTVNMVVDLLAEAFSTTADEARLEASGIAVRRAAATDRTAIDRLLERQWPSRRPEVSVALSQTPSAVHVALASTGDIAGFAAYDGNNVGTGWFGPMGTAAEWEGRGIGRVLLRRCLRDLRGRSLSHAIIPWVGPVAFYERHAAARVDRTFVRLEKRLTTEEPA
ncbi:MAG: GNAT family N-acetyltransferase [Pirellulales bacterium]